MLGLKCAGCGCTIPPDAAKCPNCGQKYDEIVRPKEKNNGHGITIGRIGYAIACPNHGRIHITAGVASPPTRCPFC
jgi:ribosomal protein L40E